MDLVVVFFAEDLGTEVVLLVAAGLDVVLFTVVVFFGAALAGEEVLFGVDFFAAFLAASIDKRRRIIRSGCVICAYTGHIQNI